jgi:hypothetical protein
MEEHLPVGIGRHHQRTSRHTVAVVAEWLNVTGLKSKLVTGIIPES